MDISCPNCGAKNDISKEYCINCGCGLSKVVAQTVQSKPSSQNNSNNSKNGSAFNSIENDEKSTHKRSRKYIAPPSAFAEGLPEWDIVPPQIMLRRR